MRRTACMLIVTVGLCLAGCKKGQKNSNANPSASPAVARNTPPVNAAAIAAILTAAREGDAAKVKALLAEGADPNAKDNDGRMPLTEAVFFDKLETVKVLLAAGADPSLKKTDGETAVTFASGKPEIIELFKNVDALVAAAGNGDNKTVSGQLAKHVPIDAKDEYGHTALTEAAWNGRAETVKLLLDNGADPNAKKSDGASALSLATGQQHKDVVDLLNKAPSRSTTQPSPTQTSSPNGNGAAAVPPK